MTNNDEIRPELSDTESRVVKIEKGNIFTSECQTLVNTVNCQGVMGAGIALEFKLRLPEMFEQYVDLCRKGEIAICFWTPIPAWGKGHRKTTSPTWTMTNLFRSSKLRTAETDLL